MIARLGLEIKWPLGGQVIACCYACHLLAENLNGQNLVVFSALIR